MNKSCKSVIVGLITIASLLIGLISCSEAPFGPTIQPFEFPLTVGNRWDYQETNSYTLFDTLSILTSTDTAYGTSSTVVFSYGFLPDSSRQLFTFYTEWETDFTEGWRSNQYDNHPDGYYYYGGSPDIWIGPSKLNQTEDYYEFKGYRASSLDELIRVILSSSQKRLSRSLAVNEIEDPPIRELAYPLKTGTRWIYRDTTFGHVWNMEKEVVGTGRISVPAGKFNCFKIKWYWDIDRDGEWDDDIDGYDYISEIGTVRRQFMFYNVVMRNYTNEIVGYYNMVSDYSLTDYKLQ